MRDRSSATRREAIEDRIDDVVAPASRGGTVPRATVDGFDDRWYGQLVLRSYESVADADADDGARSAAAAVELLRGYCRLRSELLVRSDGRTPGKRDVTASLLAGDYLYSAAYATLAEVADGRVEPCFEILAEVSETVIDAFGARYARPASAEFATFVDETAGTLGRGASSIGATLAGADRPSLDRFAALGRGFSTDRQVRHLLGDDAIPAPVASVPSPRDGDDLRRLATRRRDDAVDALEELSSAVDVSALRTLVGVDDRTDRRSRSRDGRRSRSRDDDRRE